MYPVGIAATVVVRTALIGVVVICGLMITVVVMIGEEEEDQIRTGVLTMLIVYFQHRVVE
jgi:hypothetical protein